MKRAHAIEREAKVIGALGSAGLPVGRLSFLCANSGVIGNWFYVMELVEGRIFWDATFPGVGHKKRPLYFDAMNGTIAGLHGIDPAGVSLADFSRAGSYLERQIARRSKQCLYDAEAGREPIMDQLIEWLPANVPPGKIPSSAAATSGATT